MNTIGFFIGVFIFIIGLLTFKFGQAFFGIRLLLGDGSTIRQTIVGLIISSIGLIIMWLSGAF